MIMSFIPCVFKSCLLSSMSSGLLVIPGVSVCLHCPVYPDVVIKDYYFEVYPRLRVPSFLPAVCTVTLIHKLLTVILFFLTCLTLPLSRNKPISQSYNLLKQYTE